MGKWSKFNEYTVGRDDGLALAWKIVQEGGIEALRKEIRFRNITGIHTSFAAKEVDQFTQQIKSTMFETIQVALVAILHDNFGFGQKRCKKALRAFDKLAAYLSKGWIYWVDMIEEIKEQLHLDMKSIEMQHSDMGGKYSHPEPEDIYTEIDFVDTEDWKRLLRTIGFTEKKEQEGKERYTVLDEKKNPLFSYEGQYDKIQMFDFISGMLFEKNGRHYEEERSA